MHNGNSTMSSIFWCANSYSGSELCERIRPIRKVDNEMGHEWLGRGQARCGGVGHAGRAVDGATPFIFVVRASSTINVYLRTSISRPRRCFPPRQFLHPIHCLSILLNRPVAIGFNGALFHGASVTSRTAGVAQRSFVLRQNAAESNPSKPP